MDGSNNHGLLLAHGAMLLIFSGDAAYIIFRLFLAISL
jgi:hypothetical protein